MKEKTFKEVLDFELQLEQYVEPIKEINQLSNYDGLLHDQTRSNFKEKYKFQH
jgi:hypothetical protein